MLAIVTIFGVTELWKWSSIYRNNGAGVSNVVWSPGIEKHRGVFREKQIFSVEFSDI